MEEQRARIVDDLRGQLDGELHFEPLDRAIYAADAGLDEQEPLGAVAPRSESDVIALARYAADSAVALHPRGAGTGAGGGCLGPGLVVDFSRHLRRIVAIGSDSVTVEAGAVVEVINRQLAPRGRRLAISVDGPEVRTIGGAIADDAVGLQSVHRGGCVDHLLGARIVLAGGETVELGPQTNLDAESHGLRAELAERLSRLGEYNAEALTRQTGGWRWGRTGVPLAPALTGTPRQWQRLVVGSMGSLALITQATIRTVPIPGARAVAVLPFARLVQAAEAVPEIGRQGVSACELFDWRTLSLARDADPSLRAWLPEAAEAVLVVEFEGAEIAEAAERARALADSLYQARRLVAEPTETALRPEVDRLLHLPGRIEPLLMRAPGTAHPVPVVSGLRIDPTQLPGLLELLRAQLQAHGVDGLLWTHATLAEVHLRVFLDLADRESRHRLERLGAAVREAVLDRGGTVGAGYGPDRLANQRRMLGDLWHLQRELKNAFDPQGVLNPGAVAEDDPATTRPVLRPTAAPVGSGPEPLLPIWDSGDPDAALRWPERSRSETVAACNSCGACRSQEPALRMCPTFRASHDEAASPRAQVALLRQLAAGGIDASQWGTESYKAHADLCVHCHLCTTECPSGIDVSSLMIEAKAAYVADHGLPPDDWMLSRIDLWASLASRFPIAYNSVMGGRWSRWLLERGFGLARYRRLPKAHRTSFVRRAERMGLTIPRPHEPGPRVAYFLDIFANHFDQELAEAVVAVLRHAGVNVYVPKAQRGCGMPALVSGDLDRARDLVLANLKVLGNAVRQGYTIVCSEPTAALMLRREAARLTDDLDGALVAENTMDVGQYLEGLAARGDLKRPEVPIPTRVGYHQPCHLRALDVGTPGLDLIRTIPGLEVEFIDRGCSGMAGLYGLATRGFRNSLRAGRGLIRRLRDDDLPLGATECSACRIQMEQGVAKATLHPMKLLAIGYGLNPSLRRLLDPTNRSGS